MNTIALENEALLAVFEESTGGLLELEHKKSAWKIQKRGGTAWNSFTGVAPIPERLLNTIDGRKQKTARMHRKGAECLCFVWDKLRSEHAGVLDVTATAEIRLDGDGLVFDMKIKNDSPFPVEAVHYPYIGDLGRPNGCRKLTRMSVHYCTMREAPLYPEFRNERGYWGADYPIQMDPTPESPFLLIQGEEEGLYIGCHDTAAEERTEFTFQLKPGYGKVGFVPEGRTIGDQAVHMEFMVTHLPFVQPGETVTLASIVIKPYTGDWHAGADIYREWRKTWMSRPPVPDWLNEVHSWQQIQMTSWGDTLRIPYRELIKYGEECARNGVGAIQLVGWTLYGQDGRLPIHDIDPRLGTRRELREAIRAIQDMGVKVILYEKYTCADVGTDWYKRELHRYASKDIFGNTHGHEGWQYHTPAHLAGINTRPYAWMCMHSKQWQDVALSEVEKSLDLEPAGILLDECQWHGKNAFYCFDKSHGHRIPSYNFGGDAIFERRLRELIEEKNPDLVLAGEGPYDLQYRHYILAYHRSKEGHIPTIRYIDPFLPMMDWVYGYDDRESINRCLLYRYIISYEPMNFKGHLEEFPLTLEYGKRVDALRRKYREYLWDAEFRDTVGAALKVVGRTAGQEDGDEARSCLHYSVFRQLRSGSRAVVVANHHESESMHVRVEADPPLRHPALVSPEEPDPASAAAPITIPPRSVVVLLEDYGRFPRPS